ncbi:hypothetical protein VC83_00150 [Pseudogymnoascus destructans]|uniref:Uncharacterized protein n=1 Tax=Pseudogymnoascus destructans TaxID=655981 RepID=A0A177APA3_9PEZI|nr:uncharacterized protein VC83_00150 [Pseudogymnoascus destructans]OAF63362.1 hypothetical protein VC83_00150 [Pseudogymnoascus destructans]
MVYSTAELSPKIRNIGSESPVPLTRLEKLLSEDDFEFVLPEDLVQQPDITVDYTFGNGILGQQDHGFKPQSQIRRVLNTMHEEIRPAAQSHPHVAELELKAYGREWIVKALKQGFISVPWLMFIDGFGLYRNMYRSMTGGMSLNINGDELVMAFTLGYIGDMPQQNDNAGILCQNAAEGCRSCLASKEEHGDIHFDYMRLGRYHHHQVQLREHGSTLPPAKKKAWYQQWGMRENRACVVQNITSA